MNWNIALNENHGPHNGGCATCDPMITVMNDGTVRTDANFYTVGQLSKFVKPGARRIASTSFGTTAWNGMLMDTAFRNPDGSTALVVHNEFDNPRTFAVAVGTQYFTYTVPGASLTTFTWPPSLQLVAKSFQIPLPGATVTASSNPADGAKILDGDGTTSWQSGASQTPGQFVLIDLGRPKLFSRVAVDHGMNFSFWADPADGDYARGYRIETSLDGKRWVPFANNPDNHAYLIDADTAGRWPATSGSPRPAPPATGGASRTSGFTSERWLDTDRRPTGGWSPVAPPKLDRCPTPSAWSRCTRTPTTRR